MADFYDALSGVTGMGNIWRADDDGVKGGQRIYLNVFFSLSLSLLLS